MSKRSKRRGFRYRFTTSVCAGVLLALLLAWFSAAKRHAGLPAETIAVGAGGVGALFAMALFVITSIVAVARALRRQARERERAQRKSPAGRRRRWQPAGRSS